MDLDTFLRDIDSALTASVKPNGVMWAAGVNRQGLEKLQSEVVAARDTLLDVGTPVRVLPGVPEAFQDFTISGATGRIIRRDVEGRTNVKYRYVVAFDGLGPEHPLWLLPEEVEPVTMETEERVSLAPLDPVTALRALLQVRPDGPTEESDEGPALR